MGQTIINAIDGFYLYLADIVRRLGGSPLDPETIEIDDKTFNDLLKLVVAIPTIIIVYLYLTQPTYTEIVTSMKQVKQELYTITKKVNHKKSQLKSLVDKQTFFQNWFHDSKKVNILQDELSGLEDRQSEIQDKLDDLQSDLE